MDSGEVERLYRQLAPALLAYGCSLLGGRAAAEDVLQQVFLKLLESDRPAPDDPRAYLFRAVRNAACNVRRTRGREVALGATEAWFEDSAGGRDAVLALQAALSELPEEQREVVMLHVWGELTLEQTGRVLGISPNTAASRYRYGLARLRRRLHPEEEESGGNPRT